MNFNSLGIQTNSNPQSVSAFARLLMSERRQKLQNRQQSMLHRAASEAGIDM